MLIAEAWDVVGTDPALAEDIIWEVNTLLDEAHVILESLS